ncbi:MAG: glycerophosphodiester phosphodiesterase [Actinomycetota bacterium]|nr:glycerophosphodiester phosphodiesterase [Actinomycetota bacterium]
MPALPGPAARALTVAVALAVGAAVVIGLSYDSTDRPTAQPTVSDEILVIGHRGASGERPENTMAAFELAIRMGADYLELDLVSTKDGVLVVRHENELSQTTDVAEHAEFADRRTTKLIDGRSVAGWFTEDFTLPEIKTLRAVERFRETRQANTSYDGQFEIPTLQEVLDLALASGVGLYPEIKHSTYYDSIDLSLEEPLIAALQANDLDDADDEIFVQSFESANLRELNRLLDVRLIQLILEAGAPYDVVASGEGLNYADMVTKSGLREIATYADGIGPDKDLIIPRNAVDSLGGATTLAADAHDAGLLVHTYTFRAENEFLPTDLRSSDDPAEAGDLAAELEAFLSIGVDGVITDNPDIAVSARTALQAASD